MSGVLVIRLGLVVLLLASSGLLPSSSAVSSTPFVVGPAQAFVGWGDNRYGQASAPPGAGDLVAISAGGKYGAGYSLALKTDGTVVAWGANGSRQATMPTDLANVVAVSAGGRHSLALKRDGAVVAWGANDFGQATVPAGLANVVAI